MNALVLNCSPVRDGATAWIARVAEETLSPRFAVRSVCIDDYTIAFCRGCRSCHATARCVLLDGAQELMAEIAWADVLLCVSPSYWADVPGQFKAFIDRCTPWCNTHDPHASVPAGKKGYAIVLRTGPGMRECERLIETIQHFYGHLEIEKSGALALCGVDGAEAAHSREPEIMRFLETVRAEV